MRTGHSELLLKEALEPLSADSLLVTRQMKTLRANAVTTSELRFLARTGCIATSQNRSRVTGSWDHTARLWSVAAALPDELERVAIWVEVLTGLELDDQGSARVLDDVNWLHRRKKLKQPGGPPVVGSER
jgi:hypothetical protein